MKLRTFLLALSALLIPAHADEAKPKADPFAKWETEIAAFEAADKTNPPPKGGILFIGSSTIRMWTTLAADFPGQPVINRGFGGSQIVDSTHFADRIIFPYAPKQIFLRAGGNDINAGKTPEQVFADYQAFVAAVHAKLPDTEIVYIGLCPTIARIKQVAAGDKLSALIIAGAAKNPKLKFIDCATMTPGPDGQPRADLFIKDGLHFNAAGYKLLAGRVRPFLAPAAQ